jgi:hypothetical protein
VNKQENTYEMSDKDSLAHVGSDMSYTRKAKEKLIDKIIADDPIADRVTRELVQKGLLINCGDKYSWNTERMENFSIGVLEELYTLRSIR